MSGQGNMGRGFGLDLTGTAMPGIGGRAADDAARTALPQPAARPALPVRLTAAQAALRRALFRRRGPLMLRHGQQQAAVVLGALPPGLLPDPADTPWLSMSISGAPAAAALPWPLARRLLGQPLEAAQPADAALLLEDALGEWLDAAELATGLSIRLDRLDRSCPDIADAVTARLGVDVALPRPARQGLVLRLSPGAVHALANSLTRLARPRDDVGALMLRLAVHRTAARLTLAELNSLAPGDALAMADDAEDASAVIEGQLVAPVSPAGPGRWTLARGFAPPAEHEIPFHWTTRHTQMTQTETDPAVPPQLETTSETSAETGRGATPDPASASRSASAPAAGLPSGPASLDALEVRLSVRLGETLMTLAELRQAGPGTVITLDRPDGAPVELVVNGQVIGTGQIITVAGQKACEIHSLFGDG